MSPYESKAMEPETHLIIFKNTLLIDSWQPICHQKTPNSIMYHGSNLIN